MDSVWLTRCQSYKDWLSTQTNTLKLTAVAGASGKLRVLGLTRTDVREAISEAKRATPRCMSDSVRPKTWHTTTNWAAYNAVLKARGSLTLWLDRDMHWFALPSGRPLTNRMVSGRRGWRMRRGEHRP